MFKKFILGLCFLVCSIIPVHAGTAPISQAEIQEIDSFFNSYINSANNYEDDLMKYYSLNPNIKRIVIKPSGAKEAVVIPFERYKTELKKGKFAAKLVNYKNRYLNRKYQKLSENKFKIKAQRYPMKDTEGLNAEFIVLRTTNGFKITDESLETKVQKFLEAE